MKGPPNGSQVLISSILLAIEVASVINRRGLARWQLVQIYLSAINTLVTGMILVGNVEYWSRQVGQVDRPSTSGRQVLPNSTKSGKVEQTRRTRQAYYFWLATSTQFYLMSILVGLELTVRHWLTSSNRYNPCRQGGADKEDYRPTTTGSQLLPAQTQVAPERGGGAGQVEISRRYLLTFVHSHTWRRGQTQAFGFLEKMFRFCNLVAWLSSTG